MLSEEYLKPFLLHKNQKVREEVLRYFYDYQSQNEELVSLILQSCGRYGYENKIKWAATTLAHAAVARSTRNVVDGDFVYWFSHKIYYYFQ